MDTREHNAHLLAIAEIVINICDAHEKSWNEQQMKYLRTIPSLIMEHAETPFQHDLLQILLAQPVWNDTVSWANFVRSELQS